MKNVIAVIGTASLLILALVVLAACGAQGPDLAYPAEADHLLIEADMAGGLVPPAYAENHITAFRLYGDGRVVWTDQEGPGMNVWQGHLPQEKIEKHQIRRKGSYVSFCPQGITRRFNLIAFAHQFFCNEFSNALLVIYD